MSGSTALEKIESVAIGAFDGMHRAHQKLFEHLGENGAIVVIDKEDASLTPGEYRCRFTSYPCFFFPLQRIKHLDAKGFLELLQSKFPNLKRIVVGYDFAFGKDRRYGIKDLQELFAKEVVVVDEVKIDGVSVHSRYIKELIKQGKVKEAAKLLGRYYEIEGRVVKGQGIGKKELVPTINLEVEGFLLPKEGVYATIAIINAKRYRSVTFVGHRHSIDGSFAVETHIIDDFDEKSFTIVTLRFVDFIRQNKKFSSLQELKKQIFADIAKAKEIIENV